MIVSLSQDRRSVLLSGAIDEVPSGYKSLVDIFKDLPNTVETVELESLGGRLDIALDIALEIAREVKRRGLNTFTNVRCHSACTFIFFQRRRNTADDRSGIKVHVLARYRLLLKRL